MRNYYYYRALRKTIVQFLDLFNDIKIARYGRGGDFREFLQVPLKYGPKEKIWYWINERKDDIVLPIMSATLTGIDYSLERASNKHANIIDCAKSKDTSSINKYLNPTPYDITFSLSIWSLYMHDVDQIVEQILPYFQPHVFIKLHIPELNSTFDIKVLFNSFAPEIDLEWDDENFRVLKHTLDFTVQTYLFRPIETTGTIGKIFMNYYTDANGFNSRSADIRSGSVFTSAASGESQVFTGIDVDGAGDPIYDYEIYQFGEKVGGTIRINGEPA